MGHNKKQPPTPLPHGVKLTWIGEGGRVMEEKYIPIGDNYRTQRSYVNCIKHLERQAWEVQEGMKLQAWKAIHNKK